MPIIKQPNQHFNAVLWTGNGPSSQNITGLNFQPDLVWVKNRSSTRKHNAYDSVRGTSKRLVPDDSAAEDTVAGVTAFNSNGFTVGDEGDVNANTLTFVGWTWKAGGSSTTVNTSGSISSNVSVNATAGFSIVSYTGNSTSGATIGHGLSATPKFVMIKGRSNAYAWIGQHASLGNTGAIFWSTNDAFTVNSVYWNNTSANSSVVTLGNTVSVNESGQTFVAYCWAEVEGFSRFGSYTGNGSTDGPFQYTGFEPRFIMIKRTNASGSWVIFDAARNTNNVTNNTLYPDLVNAEESGVMLIDFVSNGFKLRSSAVNEINASGSTYVYMAFAENPFKYSNAR
jgi:hypothetical protein